MKLPAHFTRLRALARELGTVDWATACEERLAGRQGGYWFVGDCDGHLYSVIERDTGRVIASGMTVAEAEWVALAAPKHVGQIIEALDEADMRLFRAAGA